MTKSQEIFLKLIKCGLSGNPEKTDSVPIEEITELAKTHICFPLMYRASSVCGFEAPKEWQQITLLTAATNYKNMNVQNKIIDMLDKAGIDYAVLKGISVAKCYPSIDLRPLGDIDILVSVENYDKAVELFAQYSVSELRTEEHHFHHNLKVDGISVEIHKDVTEYSESGADEYARVYMKDALKHTVRESVEFCNYFALKPPVQVLSLLLHLKRHFFERKTTLRMLCDYALYASSVDDEIWQKEIAPLLEKTGLDTFSDALLSICENYIGIACKSKITQSAPKDIQAKLMEEFVNDGLFNSDCETVKSAGFGEKILSMFYTINGTAKSNFRFLEKYPVLLPFFWIYIPIRFVFRKLTGKRNVKSVSGFSVAYGKRNRLSEKLNIKR